MVGSRSRAPAAAWPFDLPGGGTRVRWCRSANRPRSHHARRWASATPRSGRVREVWLSIA